MGRTDEAVTDLQQAQSSEAQEQVVRALAQPGAGSAAHIGRSYSQQAHFNLDPADPTPWFYDAIRKQSIIRPVEALEDLQQSIIDWGALCVFSGFGAHCILH